MAYDDKLEKLDLSKLSVGDIKDLKDESLKKTLMEAVRRSGDVSSFQQHISHSDHVTGGGGGGGGPRPDRPAP